MSIMVKKFGRLLLPEDELLEGRRVSSVVFAGEKKQFGPCEVRELSCLSVQHKFVRRPHHFVSFRAQKKHHRLPVLLPVHYYPVQTTLVYPIRQCLHPHPHLLFTHMSYIRHLYSTTIDIDEYACHVKNMNID